MDALAAQRQAHKAELALLKCLDVTEIQREARGIERLGPAQQLSSQQMKGSSHRSYWENVPS